MARTRKESQERARKLLERLFAAPDRKAGLSELLDEPEVELVGQLFEAILEGRYEHDYDGSGPIEFVLVDRTRCARMHFSPVPYLHKNEEGHCLMAFHNQAIANDAVRGAQNIACQAVAVVNGQRQAAKRR